jgi:hypothetical protein
MFGYTKEITEIKNNVYKATVFDPFGKRVGATFPSNYANTVAQAERIMRADYQAMLGKSEPIKTRPIIFVGLRAYSSFYTCLIVRKDFNIPGEAHLQTYHINAKRALWLLFLLYNSGLRQHRPYSMQRSVTLEFGETRADRLGELNV